MSPRKKLLLAGVGGQGVLTAARVLGDAAHAAGVEVVVSQMHGMSQRGGSVECALLFGRGRGSFLTGAADVVVAFEPLEAARAAPHVGAGTVVLVNRGTIVPHQVTYRGDGYPSVDGILDGLRERARRVYEVDGPAAVARTGVGRTLNVVMLGALAGLSFLPFDASTLLAEVTSQLPARFVEANRRAFELGMAVTGGGARRAVGEGGARRS